MCRVLSPDRSDATLQALNFCSSYTAGHSAKRQTGSISTLWAYDLVRETALRVCFSIYRPECSPFPLDVSGRLAGDSSALNDRSGVGLRV